MTPEFDDITPHPDGVDPSALIHERAYVVRAYRIGQDALVLRGAVRDQKPPGSHIPDDPAPLTIHHMVIDLTISVPSMEIVQARAVMEVHPHAACPRIEDRYAELVGLSIARGFTHKVRELFGGPRGCTHTTALLQAMAPVAMQARWSFRVADNRAAGKGPSPFATPESSQSILAMNLNTCHVWADDGEYAEQIRAGESVAVPLWISRRLTQLGRDPATWTGEA